jgi:hypothetical protein
VRIVGPGRRLPRMLLNSHVRQPVALGTIRPTILLPAQAAAVPEQHIAAVIAHEVAHLWRGDLWLLALTRWLLPVLFAHPLYWWLRGRIRDDQEALADVSAAGAAGAVDYAATLLHWVRLGRRPRVAAAVLAFWGRPSELKRRIIMLLNPAFPVESRCPGPWRYGAWSLTALAVLSLSALTLRPLPPAAADEPAKVEKKEPARPTPVQAGAKDVSVKVELAIRPALAAADKKPAMAAEVKGTVVGSDKKPVAEAALAVVLLADKEPAGAPTLLAQGKSDVRGRFHIRLAKPAPADHLVTLVGAKGYGLAWHFFNPKEAVIEVRPEQVIRGRLIDLQGQPATGVKLSVSRIGNPRSPGQEDSSKGFVFTALGNNNVQIVRGFVVDANGKMMGSAAVERGAPSLGLQFIEPPLALPFWPKPVTTDTQGRFSISGIARGERVGLQARDERFAIQVLDLKPAPSNTKESAGEVTLVASPARILEGTVVDASTGKPLPGAHLSFTSRGLGESLILASVEGSDLDWKARRTNLGPSSVAFFHTNEGGIDKLPTINSRADKDGRYRMALPLAGSYSIEITGPDGQSYLTMTRTVAWPKAAARQVVSMSLTRGAWVTGQVTESSAEMPVGNARIDFWAPSLRMPEGVRFPNPLTTGADGKFKVLLPPGAWRLVVNGAVSDFLYQKIPLRELVGDQIKSISFPNGSTISTNAADKSKLIYPDGYAVLDIKPDGEARSVAVKLRRETIKGKLVGPDGKPVAQARLFYRHPLPITQSPETTIDLKTRRLFLNHGWHPLQEAPQLVEIRNGNFDLVVRDLSCTYQLLLLDTKNRLGATAEITARKAREQTPTIRLMPCTAAVARFVDEKGAPRADCNHQLWLFLPPGPHPVDLTNFGCVLPVSQSAKLPPGPHSVDLINPWSQKTSETWGDFGRLGYASDKVRMRDADPIHYGKDLTTDAKGGVLLPALIPGATYRLVLPGNQAERFKDFKAEVGKTLDLGNIVIQMPKAAPNKQPTGQLKKATIKLRLENGK